MDQSLFEVKNWIKANSAERSAFLRHLLRILPGEFSLASSGDDFSLHYIHGKTNTSWNYIPGGKFMMGLSEEEENSAIAIEDPPPLTLERMRPCHTKCVEPFLMMRYPILSSLATSVIEISDLEDRPYFDSKNRLVPILLSRIELICLSEKLGFHIPSEAQWEYACRGGTRSLFFFGNEIPSNEELDGILNIDFSALANSKPNPFDLFGLFSGEWCEDEYRYSYDTCESEKDVYVVRGGGSLFCPWQNSGEWVFCVSAMRMPSTDTYGDMAATRFIYNIEMERGD